MISKEIFELKQKMAIAREKASQSGRFLRYWQDIKSSLESQIRALEGEAPTAKPVS